MVFLVRTSKRSPYEKWQIIKWIFNKSYKHTAAIPLQVELCPPPRGACVEVLPPGTSDVTLFGSRVVEVVIKINSGWGRWDPNGCDWHPPRKRDPQTGPHREKPGEETGRDQMRLLHPRERGAPRCWERPGGPHFSEGEALLGQVKLWFWASGLQNCGRMDFCCFEPPSTHCVLGSAAPGKEFSPSDTYLLTHWIKLILLWISTTKSWGTMAVRNDYPENFG